MQNLFSPPAVQAEAAQERPRWLALLHKPPGQDLGEDLNELACMHDFFVNILDVLTNVDAFYRNIFNILPILPVIC